MRNNIPCNEKMQRSIFHTLGKLFTDSYGVVHNQLVLVSLNTKYSPILISPEQRFKVVGKVLN